MGKDETKICSICHAAYTGYGNNAKPVNDGKCCDTCNTVHVIPHATYDPVADAGYIYLDGTIARGAAVRQHMVYLDERDGESIIPDMILDFDQHGKLIGIEMLKPREHMPRGLAAECET